MSEKQQRLVLSIIDFLNQSIEDGTVKQDDKEGLEIAVQCIGEAFGIDPSNEEQANRLSVKPATLPTIFDVFLKTRDRLGSDAQTTPINPAPVEPTKPSSEDKKQAEKFKQEGNALMSSKQYDRAIDVYGKAIDLDPINPIYYSNRAAAHSSKGDHLSAVGDAEKAIEVEPNFVKAYHRLGHAQYSLSDYAAAAAAFRRGLELDPTNAGLKSGLQNAEARIETEPAGAPSNGTPAHDAAPTAPGGGGFADMMRGLGGMGGAGGAGGAGGGMPDLAGLMSNPMMMQMAQQMMANGGMERLMGNPSVANMMERVRSGGGMPSMEELMADPTLSSLASQFGAGGAAP